MVKNLPVNARDAGDKGSIPVGKIPERKAWELTPGFLTCLENPMDRGAWWAMVHEVTKSQR